ncbi:hypothetical protein PTTG_03409 [Puccinia triticina 1-1 BBBD Race 1]|uniref:Uncharacterized protein n=1 Tax=Puccinia triticina (isolate 1-1 / race 1 (BBBD)) TaxID=630390 RepID=A0A180GTS7_PUCT1|nr:hypothetical protein PTTG_03409 [Puccinia triticina 1-1 BBBD Race 1]
MSKARAELLQREENLKRQYSYKSGSLTPELARPGSVPWDTTCQDTPCLLRWAMHRNNTIIIIIYMNQASLTDTTFRLRRSLLIRTSIQKNIAKDLSTLAILKWLIRATSISKAHPSFPINSLAQILLPNP